MVPFASLRVTQRSAVVLEWLGLLACLCGSFLENVDQTEGRFEEFDAGLHNCEVGIVPEAKLVEAVSLGAADVTGGGTAGGVRVFVKADQGLPVLVAGALDRFADQLPGEWHVRVPGAAPNL